MNIMKNLFTIIFIFFINGFIHSQQIIVTSPDGSVEVELKISERLSPYPVGNRLYYSVKFKGRTVLLDSPFGIDFKDMPPLATDLKIVNNISKEIYEEHIEVWGKNKNTTNHCNETELVLAEENGMKRKFSFIVRAYNDGIAIRYAFGSDAGFKDFNLTSEQTEFHFAANHRIWAADYFGQQTTNYMDHITNTQTLLRPSDWPASYSGYYSHQESEFKEQFLNHLSPNKVYGCPILLEVERDLWAAITEANLTDWAGMYLSHHATSRNALVTALSPRIDEKDVLVKSTAPRNSPWRVIMIGENPGVFIESDIITNLNEPCVIEDPSWIAPGKSSWDRWWSGSYAPDLNHEVGMNQETMKYFIDFASEMGWEYQLVDWTWYGAPFYTDTWTSDPARDITKSIPEVDIPELVKYAASKNVKILLWLEWEHSKNQMHEAFPLYEKWGVAGVKIDFMQRDDQEMVNYYHETVKLAAKHKLTVDFHGAYKPTGWERTYPNMITREGILGNEYNKWSSRITPDHCLTLPFTRAMLGQADFTPGGFLNRNKDDFKVVGGDEPAPQVMGTRAYQLAMMIVYFSPLQVLCDSPFNYRNYSDGLEFLKTVPTVWDETKFIQGEVGNYITIARRSGDTWFIGSMTDWTPRELEVDLSFLPHGNYTSEIISDPESIDGHPMKVKSSSKNVKNSTNLKIKLASGGGNVIIIKPKK